MHEVELKSAVDDLLLRRRKVERAGGWLYFEGTMEDWYYTHASEPESGVNRLRVRAYRTSGRAWSELTWKGPAHQMNGYKVREELTLQVEAPETSGFARPFVNERACSVTAEQARTAQAPMRPWPQTRTVLPVTP
ncbi:hypothetical protein [Myxococcus eversor]|uniref:hypothetical protein n=1 Tax=Myxococcus eversor TaxID=2709661 RepID=UPI0013D88440|nr:hypothetical protein [Myxococcus eversor]